MKKSIHPDYHEIKVVMTDGTEFTTKSTLGKPGEVLKLDVDPLSHPAWTGGGTQLEKMPDKLQDLKRSLEISKFRTDFF